MAKKAKNLKPAAISFLRKWRECLLTAIERREKELATELRAAIPESLATWRENCSAAVISGLIKVGRVTRKYNQDRPQGLDCGYTDLGEFVQRFKQLKTAWHGVVRIKIIWEGAYSRFEIFFTAV